jgi:uncharacterized membrane protein
MPLIRNFRATDVWKAFILNSLLTSVIILVSITSKQYLDNFIEDDDTNETGKNIRKTSLQNILISFLLTFIICMLSYTIMYYIFGFGGGMITT